MSSLIEEAQDRAIAKVEVPDNSWWTYRGTSDHDSPEGLVHVIKASDEEFQKVVYITTGIPRIKYSQTYSNYREQYEIMKMAQLERGIEEMLLRQFKLWISQGTFQRFKH
jgi:hypothetical protein